MPKKRASLQTQLDEQRKIIDGLIADLNHSKKQIEANQHQIDASRVQIEAGRKHSRSIAYTQMLNTFLNIIKYAQKRRRHPRKIVDDARRFAFVQLNV